MNSVICNDISQILISEEEIKEKVASLGAQITEEYRGKNLVLVAILKGSVVLMADLMRSIDIPVEIDFMSVSSYGSSATSSGTVKIIKDLQSDLSGKHILFVEDILDSGRTLSCIKNLMENRGAESVKIATLLDKPEGRKVDITADYCCFEIPTKFVVGYGLDFNEKYRNLPYIGVLKEEIYK